MKKKIIACMLAATMLLTGLTSFAGAIESSKESAVIQLFSALGIMSGYPDGSFGGYDSLTRGQFSKILVAGSSNRDTVSQTGGSSPFADVPYTHWAASYVQAAASLGLLYGYPDGSYKPENAVLVEEGVTAVLRLLGYSDSDFGTSWPQGQMALARNIGLLDQVSSGMGEAMTRYDTMYLMYNLFNTKTKGNSTYYAQTLGYSMSGSSIDISAALDQSMAGPVTAVGAWYVGIGLDPSDMVVYRSGIKSTYSEIAPYDCIYYSRRSNTVWAYSDKITGIYESAFPNTSNPSSVVISGNTYSIETAEAYGKLAAGGEFSTGDTVTIILGKNGDIADVFLPSIATSTTTYGYLMDAGTKVLSDGETVTRYAKVMLSSGDVMEYTTDSTYSGLIGMAVRVDYGMGNVVLSTASGNNTVVSGLVDYETMTLGGYTMASDIKILDVSAGLFETQTQYALVYPQRLDGITLKSSQILACVFNEKNQICQLFLEGVTNDMMGFGVITSANVTTGGTTKASYTILLEDGTTLNYSTNNLAYEYRKDDPVMVDRQGSLVYNISHLTSLSEPILSLEANYLATEDKNYILSSDVMYLKEYYGEYVQVSAGQLGDLSSCTLYGFYDKDQEDGGRIRVILIR